MLMDTDFEWSLNTNLISQLTWKKTYVSAFGRVEVAPLSNGVLGSWTTCVCFLAEMQLLGTYCEWLWQFLTNFMSVMSTHGT